MILSVPSIRHQSSINRHPFVMIYVDASRYNNTAKRTGVENYSFFLINELVGEHRPSITLISPRPLPLNAQQVIIPFPRLWTHIRLSLFFLTRRTETLFVPSHVLPLIHPKKSVITIHDVAFLRHPESYGIFSRLYLDWAARFAVRHAHKIIVPSQATKKDLMAFYKAKEDKIHVIPLGFSPETPTSHQKSDKGLEAFGLSAGKFFLYVGRIENKKNTGLLLQAFAAFSKKYPEYKLVLAGAVGRGGEKIIKDLPDDLKNHVVRTGYIGETEKNLLMENALCFVFPSKYEGFGLPLLEAMGHNLPIIASDIPSSREIAEDGALFFENENAAELTMRMEEILSPERRAELIAPYPNTVKKYSWMACAKSTWNVLS